MNLATITLCSMLLAGSPKSDADKKLDAKTDAKTDGGVALTPMDQSGSERDMKLTQSIRKALMDDDRLSFSSKNVKVITREGHVTLRGQVPNKTEHNVVCELARKVAGAKHVTDDLEYPNNAPQNTN